jgi:hypothetical protein
MAAYVLSICACYVSHGVASCSINRYRQCLLYSCQLFRADGVCCVGRYVSTHVCHLQVRFVVTIILSCSQCTQFRWKTYA